MLFWSEVKRLRSEAFLSEEQAAFQRSEKKFLEKSVQIKGSEAFQRQSFWRLWKSNFQRQISEVKRSYLKQRETFGLEKKNISFNARWQDISLPCCVSAIFTVSYASYCKSTQQPVQRIVSLGVKILLYWGALELGIATFIFSFWRREKEAASVL